MLANICWHLTKADVRIELMRLVCSDETAPQWLRLKGAGWLWVPHLCAVASTEIESTGSNKKMEHFKRQSSTSSGQKRQSTVLNSRTDRENQPWNVNWNTSSWRWIDRLVRSWCWHPARTFSLWRLLIVAVTPASSHSPHAREVNWLHSCSCVRSAMNWQEEPTPPPRWCNPAQDVWGYRRTEEKDCSERK